MLKLILSLVLISNIAFAATDREKLPEQTKMEIINVLKVNEGLHTSFFKYNAKDVEKNAKDLIQAMDKINDPQIKKLLNYSKSQIGQINPTKTRKNNNQLYNMVSMALTHLINKYDLGSGYNVYHCPMVKMKWVQNSTKMKKVHNPYAPNMPHCGERLTDY
ncbi:MAG: hypothetical protein DRQ88_09555 [Epsilonproteobacteria bacterium]|nr:MAG: hypothetical protein DRQ89_06760 [Campylobacterota bacterium]RLA65311.1 MAG: hypothetical protein DRQ88_09555 [Campylobacterota bacterium]